MIIQSEYFYAKVCAQATTSAFFRPGKNCSVFAYPQVRSTISHRIGGCRVAQEKKVLA